MRRVWKESFWEFESRCVCVCVCVCVVASLRDYFLSDTWAIARAFYIRKAVSLHYRQQRYANTEARTCLHEAKLCATSDVTVCWQRGIHKCANRAEGISSRNCTNISQSEISFSPQIYIDPISLLLLVRPVSHYINQIPFIELCCVVLCCIVLYCVVLCCIMLAA